MAGNGGERPKRLRAAALRYERERDSAPRLTARGEGVIAEKIIDIALEHGVPITRDPDLLSILSRMDVGEVISPALYEIVAELLVFVYRIKEKARMMNEEQEGA
jgi:flagellar biosynthesis protein